MNNNGIADYYASFSDHNYNFEYDINNYSGSQNPIKGANGHSITELNSLKFDKTGSAYITYLSVEVCSNLGSLATDVVVDN